MTNKPSVELPGMVSRETAEFMGWPILPAPGSHLRIVKADDGNFDILRVPLNLADVDSIVGDEVVFAYDDDA